MNRFDPFLLPVLDPLVDARLRFWRGGNLTDVRNARFGRSALQRQWGQYHLPFGFEVMPMQSKWNHCSLQWGLPHSTHKMSPWDENGPVSSYSSLLQTQKRRSLMLALPMELVVSIERLPVSVRLALDEDSERKLVSEEFLSNISFSLFFSQRQLSPTPVHKPLFCRLFFWSLLPKIDRDLLSTFPF